MKNVTKGMVAAAALAAWMTPGVASAIVVDTFSEGPQTVSVSAAPGTDTDTVTGLTTTETIGGARMLTLELLESDFGGTSSDVVNTAMGLMSYNNDSGNLSTLEVLWDADGAGLGGVDITDGGTDIGLSLALLASDLGGVIEFTIMDTAAEGGDSASLALVAPDSASILFFTYEDFVGVGDVNLEMIDSIKMVITPEKDGDYTIDLLESGNPIPEPVTASLGALGIAALGTTLRRRQA